MHFVHFARRQKSWAQHIKNEIEKKSQINTSDGSETYQLTRASEQQQMEIMNYANNARCGGGVNPNGAEGADGFNYSSWRNRETIILYTGELGDKAGELTGYKEVALPWAKIDKQINIPQSYYSGHLDTYNYNVKRAYDKIKYYYPNANISYEEKK